MRILFIARVYTNDDTFEHFEVTLPHVGSALLMADKILRTNGNTWQIELFDIVKRHKIYTLTA